MADNPSQSSPHPSMSDAAKSPPLRPVSSGASATASPVSRSASLRSARPPYAHSSQRSLSGGESTPSHGPRHLSAGQHSRPAPQLTPGQREQFEVAVASSGLAQSSDGLQALLRDHPELVSSSLAAAAGPSWNEFESVRGSRKGSGHTTPGAPDSEPGGANSPDQQQQSLLLQPPNAATASTTAAAVGAGSAAANAAASSADNLGSAGDRPDYSQDKIVVAMVGLPARGKSYLSNKLMRYLRWLEYDVKVFNVGQMRRALAKAKLQQSGVKEDHTASFFDPSNPSAYQLRTQMAEQCLEQLISWLKQGGNVGIHDATNSSKARRKAIADRVAKEPGLKLVFLESICTDPAVIAANVAVKVSSGDPDYAHMSPETAKEDFLKRIRNYEAGYEPINEDGSETELSYCKITDVGRSVVINQFHGYLESRIAFYLMNLHVTPRNIFFSRHGESQYNVEGKIGGDSDLSERGWAYARALPGLVKDAVGDAPLTVWHSTLKRTGQTASLLPYPKLAWKSLDELDAGVCDAMTYEEIEQYYPEDYASRDEDKFNYRYRGGESYRDVVVRLEPIIMELERQENILIIGHQAILRCLYAYFHALSQEDLPYIKIPLHTVICLTPKAYGCDEKRYQLPIQAVDTHRPRPAKAAAASTATATAGAAGAEGQQEDATSLPPSMRRKEGSGVPADAVV